MTWEAIDEAEFFRPSARCDRCGRVTYSAPESEVDTFTQPDGGICGGRWTMGERDTPTETIRTE